MSYRPFPAFIAFQLLFLGCLRKAYPAIPRELDIVVWRTARTKPTSNLLRSVILGDSNPENVILLEIEPEKQKTRIDFACTETLLGVRPVCLTNVKKKRRDNSFTIATGARRGSNGFTIASFSMS